jgi:hypothetical protein
VSKTPEGAVKKEINKVLDKYTPDLWYHMPVQNGMGKPCLDYHMCHRGWYVAIEAKAPGKKLTDRQYITMQEIERAGGTVFIIDGTENTTTYQQLDGWLATR